MTTLAEAPTEHPGRAGVRLRPALAVLLGGALLVGLCLALPAGRRQLQLSFTQVSEPYTEIFFTAAPVLAAPAPDGSRVVDVSFAVREHNGRGNPIPFEARALTVEGLVASRTGDVVGSAPGSSTQAGVELALPAGVALPVIVQVRLPGRSAEVHYTVQLSS